MHLEWTRPAIQDLKEAGDFIALDKPDAAARIAEKIKDAVEYLTEYPNMGRPGRISGTRELVVSGTPFIIVTRVGSGLLIYFQWFFIARHKWFSVSRTTSRTPAISRLLNRACLLLDLPGTFFLQIFP